MKLLTRLSIENLFHPFQTFILGQKNLGPRLAAKLGIPLVFYGENEAEYGNPIADTTTSLRDKSFHHSADWMMFTLAACPSPSSCKRYDVRVSDLMCFLPARSDELARVDVQVHYLGYYLKWTPQEVYYYAVENCGFAARPFRTQEHTANTIVSTIKLTTCTTTLRLSSSELDAPTYDAAQEIRNGHITREEGVAAGRQIRW